MLEGRCRCKATSCRLCTSTGIYLRCNAIVGAQNRLLENRAENPWRGGGWFQSTSKHTAYWVLLIALHGHEPKNGQPLVKPTQIRNVISLHPGSTWFQPGNLRKPQSDSLSLKKSTSSPRLYDLLPHPWGLLDGIGRLPDTVATGLTTIHCQLPAGMRLSHALKKKKKKKKTIHLTCTSCTGMAET